MRTIKVTTYKCDHCEFTSQEQREVSLHEKDHKTNCKHENCTYRLSVTSSGVYANCRCDKCKKIRSIKVSTDNVEMIFNFLGGRTMMADPN